MFSSLPTQIVCTDKEQVWGEVYSKIWGVRSALRHTSVSHSLPPGTSSHQIWCKDLLLWHLVSSVFQLWVAASAQSAWGDYDASADIFTCHCHFSKGVTNNFNDDSVSVDTYTRGCLSWVLRVACWVIFLTLSFTGNPRKYALKTWVDRKIRLTVIIPRFSHYY